MYGSLPDTYENLQILENEVVRRLTYLNGKSVKLYNNAAYCQSKGDAKKALLYMRERKEVVDEITKLGKRLGEVQTKIVTMPRPKIEVASPLIMLQAK